MPRKQRRRKRAPHAGCGTRDRRHPLSRRLARPLVGLAESPRLDRPPSLEEGGAIAPAEARAAAPRAGFPDTRSGGVLYRRLRREVPAGELVVQLVSLRNLLPPQPRDELLPGPWPLQLPTTAAPARPDQGVGPRLDHTLQSQREKTMTTDTTIGRPSLEQLMNEVALLEPGPEAWAPIFRHRPELTAADLAAKFREQAERLGREADQLRAYRASRQS